MLEQIAWSFAVCNVNGYEEARHIASTKAIGALKKKIPRVEKLYGELSNYVHIPIDKHGEFISINTGATKVSFQFGDHSLLNGMIIRNLAYYWVAVYECTQARSFNSLESWSGKRDNLTLRLDHPFVTETDLILSEMRSEYENRYISYEEHLRANWTIPEREHIT